MNEDYQTALSLSTSWKAYRVIEAIYTCVRWLRVARHWWLAERHDGPRAPFILPLCWLQSGRVCIGHIWPITHLSRMPEAATCARQTHLFNSDRVNFRPRGETRTLVEYSLVDFVAQRMRFPAGIFRRSKVGHHRWKLNVSDGKGSRSIYITRNRGCYLIDSGKLVVISSP